MLKDERLSQNFHFSIIVPTFREAKNIPALVERIAAIDFGKRKFELILVDDNSDDGTHEVVNTLRVQYPWVKLHIRKKSRNLSQSILDGFKHAKYPYLITMDADLSHPPEKIIELLNALADPKVDLAVGSRYIKNGSVDPKWPLRRIFSSRISALIARLFLFLPTKDPLSGFIAIHKSKILQVALKPIGWKVGLEIIVKCKCKNICEVPIHFSERSIGKSKLTAKIALAYFQHVLQLFWYKVAHG